MPDDTAPIEDTGRNEVEGMRLVPDSAQGVGVEPWATRLKPPHPRHISIAAGALITITVSLEQAYMVAYTLADAGLLYQDTVGPFRVGGHWGVTVVHDPEPGEKTGTLWATAQKQEWAQQIVDALNTHRPPALAALKDELIKRTANWNAARAANMTAIETIGTLKDERQLLLWLHAEAVHQRDEHRFHLNDALGIVGAEEDIDPYEAVAALHTEIDGLRAERDELQGHGVSRDIGEANERMRAELAALKANAVVLPEHWCEHLSGAIRQCRGVMHPLDSAVTAVHLMIESWLGHYCHEHGRIDTTAAHTPDTEATEQPGPRGLYDPAYGGTDGDIAGSWIYRSPHWLPADPEVVGDQAPGGEA